MRGRASSLQSSGGSTDDGHILGTLAVTQVMDINIDPSCDRAMDPNMALGGKKAKDGFNMTQRTTKTVTCFNA